jgi:hypothetical protein
MIELGIGAAAFLLDGPMAAAAAVIGSSIAMAAQIVAVAILRPAMKGSQAQFNQKWVVGMAARFGSFIVLAVLMVVLKDTLPVAWMAGGYLGLLLVLLFAETRFLT